MKNKSKRFLFISISIVLFLLIGIGFYNLFTSRMDENAFVTVEEVNELTTEETIVTPESTNNDSFLEENNCRQDSDCSYIWYTGACNTPEYVAKQQEKAREMGMYIGEAPPREGVTCTCEANKCVTHN